MYWSFLTEAFNDVTHGLYDHAEDEHPTARPGDQQYTVGVPVQHGVAVLGRGLIGIPLQAKDYYISCKTNVKSQIQSVHAYVYFVLFFIVKCMYC